MTVNEFQASELKAALDAFRPRCKHTEIVIDQGTATTRYGEIFDPCRSPCSPFSCSSELYFAWEQATYPYGPSVRRDRVAPAQIGPPRLEDVHNGLGEQEKQKRLNPKPIHTIPYINIPSPIHRTLHRSRRSYRIISSVRPSIHRTAPPNLHHNRVESMPYCNRVEPPPRDGTDHGTQCGVTYQLKPRL